jgi:hypothetical protein
MLHKIATKYQDGSFEYVALLGCNNMAVKGKDYVRVGHKL